MPFLDSLTGLLIPRHAPVAWEPSTPAEPTEPPEAGYWDANGRGYTHSSGNLYPREDAPTPQYCQVNGVIVDLASPEYAAWFAEHYGDGEYYG